MNSAHLRRGLFLLGIVLAGALTAAVAGCGGGNGQLSVSLSLDSNSNASTYKPGDTPTFVLRVDNNGPGDAPGVSLKVDLPGNFRYKSHDRISGWGDARTQPIDAEVGVSDPQWGVWDLAAPAASPPPNTCASCVIVPFSVDVEGSPKTYTMTGHAQGDNTSGVVSSGPLSVTLKAAAKLSLTATVSPSVVKENQVATYRVTITNSGDGPASNIMVLVTLPPIMGFDRSITPFTGNGSRSNPIDPGKGAVEVFYSGFVLPPDSSGGPGIVTIVFKADVAGKLVKGTYPLTIQVNDDDGDQVYLVNAAPVSVSAPTVTPGATPAPTRSPGQ